MQRTKFAAWMVVFGLTACGEVKLEGTGTGGGVGVSNAAGATNQAGGGSAEHTAGRANAAAGNGGTASNSENDAGEGGTSGKASIVAGDAGDGGSKGGGAAASAGEAGLPTAEGGSGGTAGAGGTTGIGGVSGVPGCEMIAGTGSGGASSSAHFDGLWISGKANYIDSCSGALSQRPFIMRLRTTTNGTLQFVELDQRDLNKEFCVLNFSVAGNVATLKGPQKCDPGPYERTFLCDRLEWLNGVVREVGVMQRLSDQTVCTGTFDYEYSPQL
jgi:hypothetical protein